MQAPKASPRSTEEAHESERHDAIYAKTRAKVRRPLSPDDWERFDRIDVPLHPYHASVKWLGDVRGKRILDVGCGDGWFSVILAKRGARVDAFDISVEGVLAAREWAEQNAVADRCEFRTGSAYEIPFPGNSYDLVAGQSILHHVGDKAALARELHRVLLPGGRGVFHEPFGNSLLLERLRRLVPIPSGAPDDPDQWRQQLKYRELAPFREYFEVGTFEFEFLARLERLPPMRSLGHFLRSLDHRLLKAVPLLRPYARSIVITILKQAQAPSPESPIGPARAS